MKLATFAFVIVSSFALPARAALFAGDAKTYPATFCRPVDGTDGEVDYRTDGSIANNSFTHDLQIVCPISRDNTQNDLNQYFDIFVGNAGPEDLACTATSHEPFATFVDDDTDSVGVAGGTQVIELNLVHQDGDGYTELNCWLPPRNNAGGIAARLFSYTVEELGIGDLRLDTDSKTFTGTFVEQGWFLDIPPPAGPYIAYEDIGAGTRAYNTGAYGWVLPLVRDIVAEDWNRARMRVVDNDPEADFACTFNAYTEDGEIDGALSGFGDQQDPMGETTVEFHPLDTVHFATSNNGPYAIDCIFTPVESTLLMYDLREEQK